MTAMARELEASPRLVVRSAAADPVRLEAALTGAANTAGYAGQLVFKSEPGMATGAFSFDWGDGRASFDPLASAARIEAALHAALAAEGLHAEPLSLNGDAP
jgi:flagellar assembly protein FliH